MTVRKTRIFESGGKIDDIIDPNNVFMGDDNTIQKVYDPESGKTFDNDNPNTPDPGDQKQDDIKDNDKKTDGTPDDNDKPQWVNAADYVLKVAGYQEDELQWGEEKKKIADLTPDEQIKVLVEEFENAVAYIHELKNKPAEQVEFKNEDEKQIIEFLRNGGNKKELAKFILSNDPVDKFSAMSNEEILKVELKKEYPNYTDEEIDDEINYLKEKGRLDKRADIYRERYKANDPDINALIQAQKEEQEKQAKLIAEKHEKEANELRALAKNTKKIAGVDVTEDIMNKTLAKLIPQNPAEESEFLRTLSSPEALLRAQFLYDNFETIMKNTVEYWYKKGQEGKEKVLRKFSDEPFGFSGTAKKTAPVQPKTVEDIDMNTMLNITEL